MEDSELMPQILGEQVYEHFLRNKRAEWQDYRLQVTPYELQRNLGIL
jgi:glutamine synthetase